MTAHALPGTRAGTPTTPNPVGRTQLIRDALGRAHYERLAAGCAAGGVTLTPWDHLQEATRQVYRARLDYALPLLNEALDAIAVLGLDDAA